MHLSSNKKYKYDQNNNRMQLKANVMLWPFVLVNYVLQMGGRVSIPEGVHVVIVGGGFGGIAAAHQLKSQGVDFTLIDMRDAFHHNVAALRAALLPGTSLSLINILSPCCHETWADNVIAFVCVRLFILLAVSKISHVQWMGFNGLHTSS